MNSPFPAPRRNWARRLVNAGVALVVIAVAAAAFVFSYDGVHAIALFGGISAKLARYYPGLFDAVLVVACVAAVVPRDARWWARLWAWLVIIVLLAAIGTADVLHAMNYTLRHRPTEGVVAAAPVVAVLLAFSLLLVILRQSRTRVPVPAPPTAPVPVTADLPALPAAVTVASPAIALPAAAEPTAAQPTREFAAPPPREEPVLGDGPVLYGPVVAGPIDDDADSDGGGSDRAVPDRAVSDGPVDDDWVPDNSVFDDPPPAQAVPADAVPAETVSAETVSAEAVSDPVPSRGPFTADAGGTAMPTPPDGLPVMHRRPAAEPAEVIAPAEPATEAAEVIAPSQSVTEPAEVVSPPEPATVIVPAVEAPAAVAEAADAGEPVVLPARRPIRYAGSGPARGRTLQDEPAAEPATEATPVPAEGVPAEADAAADDYWDRQESGPYAGLVYAAHDEDSSTAAEEAGDTAASGPAPRPETRETRVPPPFAAVPGLNRVRSTPAPPADDEDE